MTKRKYNYLDLDNDNYECGYCGKEYTSTSGVRGHIKREHLSIGDKNKKTKPEIKIERIEKKEIPKEDKLDEMYDAVKEFNKSLQKLDESNRNISFNIEGDFIAVLVISDLHYGNENVEMEYVERLINFVKKYPRAYCILNGDIIDNWVKLAPNGGIYEQTIKPEYQTEIMVHKLEPIKDKILGIVMGNHEGRSQKQGEKNPTKTMAQKFNVPYLGPGGRINLTINGIEYRLHIRHRFRYESSFNPCHSCGRLIEQLDSEADIVGIGHKHDPAVEVRYKAGKQRSFMRFGSAMPSTKYSDYLGYGKTPLVAPTVLLSGDKKMHHPFIDLDIVKIYIRKEG